MYTQNTIKKWPTEKSEKNNNDVFPFRVTCCMEIHYSIQSQLNKTLVFQTKLRKIYNCNETFKWNFETETFHLIYYASFVRSFQQKMN